MADRLSLAPQATLPSAFSRAREIKAAYRLLDQPDLAPSKVDAGPFALTAAAGAGC